MFDTSLAFDERSSQHLSLLGARCCLILGGKDWWPREIVEENTEPGVFEGPFVGPEDLLFERGMWTEPHEVTANQEDILNDLIDIRNGNPPSQEELLLEPDLIQSSSVWSPDAMIASRKPSPMRASFHPQSSFSTESNSGKMRTTKMRIQKARASHQW